MNRTIFISSTFTDLQSHRKAVWDLLATFDVNIRGMERFGARSENPLVTCMAELEQADIYVGIIAQKAGSIEPSSGKSYTQLEYEFAYERKKEILMFLLDTERAPVLEAHTDFGERREKLNAFKSILKERHTIASFTTERDLAEKLSNSLRSILAPKNDATSAPPDEFQRSNEVLRSFVLLPRVTSGTEVRLRVKFPRNFAPASKEACVAFNLPFGATAVAGIQLLIPPNLTSLDTLLIPAKFVPELLPLEDKEGELYATPVFSEKNVKSFVGKLGSVSGTVLRDSGYDSWLNQAGLEEMNYEVEGAVALIVTKVA
jgi:hypothetical protein